MVAPYVITHDINAAFTGNHGDGTIEVSAANAALLWPGARAIIGSSTQPSVEVLILEDLGGGHLKVRIDETFAPAAGGPVTVRVPGAGSDFSAYLVADAAYIHQYANQYIFPYTRDGIVPRTPSALAGGQ